MGGIDLDIEGCIFKELRKLMDNDPKRNYLITGVPQFPYPDH